MFLTTASFRETCHRAGEELMVTFPPEPRDLVKLRERGKQGVRTVGAFWLSGRDRVGSGSGTRMASHVRHTDFKYVAIRS